MPPKKKTGKDTKKTNVSSGYEVSEVVNTRPETFTNEQLTGMMRRLGLQLNLFVVVIAALFVFQGYTFYKLTELGKAGVVQGEQESPLSEDKLKEYAKDLNLDMKKFDQCYESEEAKNFVAADAAYASEVGVSGTPGFFINGRFLGGAFPFETFKEIIDKELDGTGSNLCESYSEDLQQYCSDPANAPFKPEQQSVRVGGSPISGSREAPVIIVEFSDFECPFCARAFGTVNQIKQEYGDQVSIAYKHLPLSFHANAETSARASYCAQQQGKFWEYHDKLFEVQL